MYNLILLKLVCEEMGFYRPDVKFLQIGANDGEIGDICGTLARQYGWSGVAVEPIPEIFERLVATYGTYPKITPLNAALGTKDGKAVFYKVDHPHPAAQQLESFRKDVILKHADDFKNKLGLILEDAIVEIEVNVISIKTLLKDLSDLRCMFVDAEGYDWEIIKSIDFDLTHPDLMYFETAHVNEQPEEIKKFFNKLEYTLYKYLYESIAITNDLHADKFKVIQYASNTWVESDLHKKLLSYCESDGIYTIKKTGEIFRYLQKPLNSLEFIHLRSRAFRRK